MKEFTANNLDKFMINENEEFSDNITFSLWEECIKFKIAFDNGWHCVAQNCNDEQKAKLDLDKRVLPMFEELLAFEPRDYVYTCLYASNNLPKTSYILNYHMEDANEFDILVVDCRNGNGNIVKALIKPQLRLVHYHDHKQFVKAINSLPCNIKGVIMHDSITDTTTRFYGKNYLSMIDIFENENVDKACFDLYKRQAYDGFITDYPEYETQFSAFIEAVKDTIKLLQISFEQNQNLKSNNKNVQRIYNSKNISTFIKYEFENVKYDDFLELQDELINVLEASL